MYPGALHIALIHRKNWYRDRLRIDGQFAYPVPGLTWQHVPVEKSFELDVSVFKKADLVWLDDGKYGRIAIHPMKGKRISPLVMYALYPTLADHIRESRQARARELADLVLLDHDLPHKWEDPSYQTRLLPYSVNDLHYRDRGFERDIDVGFYCVWGHNPARPAFERWLADHCKRAGFRFWGLGGRGVGTHYAELLARTKVVVHLNRTPETRAPRLFDASACGAAVLTNPVPHVPGEAWVPGYTYMSFSRPVDRYEEGGRPVERFTDDDCQEVIGALDALLRHERWVPIASNARTMVLSQHTWSRRAVELRGILLDCFPQLRAKHNEEWRYNP